MLLLLFLVVVECAAVCDDEDPGDLPPVPLPPGEVGERDMLPPFTIRGDRVAPLTVDALPLALVVAIVTVISPRVCKYERDFERALPVTASYYSVAC